MPILSLCYQCSILVYRDYGWQGLIEEVEMDVKRISHRNLGRDDRQVGLYCINMSI